MIVYVSISHLIWYGGKGENNNQPLADHLPWTGRSKIKVI
jgi:hypothetical protein